MSLRVFEKQSSNNTEIASPYGLDTPLAKFAQGYSTNGSQRHRYKNIFILFLCYTACNEHQRSI